MHHIIVYFDIIITSAKEVIFSLALVS